MAPKCKDQLGSVGEWMGSLCYPSFSKGSNVALFWLFGLLNVFWPAGRLDRNVWLNFWVLLQEVGLGPIRQSRHPLWRLLRIGVQGSALRDGKVQAFSPLGKNIPMPAFRSFGAASQLWGCRVPRDWVIVSLAFTKSSAWGWVGPAGQIHFLVCSAYLKISSWEQLLEPLLLHCLPFISLTDSKYFCQKKNCHFWQEPVSLYLLWQAETFLGVF